MRVLIACEENGIRIGVLKKIEILVTQMNTGNDNIMKLLGTNTKKELIGEIPYNSRTLMPNEGDYLMFEGKEYRVIARSFEYPQKFKYPDGELDLISISVKQL